MLNASAEIVLLQPMFSVKKSKDIEGANSPARHKPLSISSFRQKQTDLLPINLIPRISEAPEKLRKSQALNAPS